MSDQLYLEQGENQNNPSLGIRQSDILRLSNTENGDETDALRIESIMSSECER